VAQLGRQLQQLGLTDTAKLSSGAQTVWRLKAQFRREIMEELGVNSVQELNTKLSGLWGYFTRDWLILTVPAPSDPNRSRRPNHPLWSELAAVARGDSDKSRLKRFRAARLLGRHRPTRVVDFSFGRDRRDAWGSIERNA